jgi:hypothetical protein
METVFAEPFDRGRNANPQLDIATFLTLIATQMWNVNKNIAKTNQISWKDQSRTPTRNAKRRSSLSAVDEVVEAN